MSKSSFHHKNLHQSGYDLELLCTQYPPLQKFVFVNQYGTTTIDFANPKAVKKLNRALLFTYYNLNFWDFPDVHLCPPIPSRVDYIHHLADLIKKTQSSQTPHLLDIGTGASCIYPLLGNASYQWNFTATDVDKASLTHAKKIIKKNSLQSNISLRHQNNISQIFKGIITPSDRFMATLCNPPFYGSAKEAQQANDRKQQGLKKVTGNRNFSGTSNELWYKGGEKAFLHTYLYESSLYKTNCFWFTTLVSKKENLKSMYTSLKKLGATQVHTITMHQGNKVTRFVAWTFLTPAQQKQWK